MRQKAKIENMITIVKDGRSFKIPPDGTQGFSAVRIGQQGSGYELKIPIQGDDKPDGLSLGLDASCYIGIRYADHKPGMMSQMDDVPEERGMMQGPSVHEGRRPWVKEKSIEDREIWFQVILAKQE